MHFYSMSTKLKDFRAQMAFARRVMRSIRAPKGSAKYVVGSLARYSHKLKHKVIGPTEIPSIKDADILVVLPHKRFLGTLKPPVGAKVRSGGSRRLALTVEGRKVDVFVALKEEKPFALLQYVNSRLKNIAMRKRARVLGLKLNQFGLFRSGKKLSIRSPKKVLDILGMDAIYTT